jgi:hypothetical protein
MENSFKMNQDITRLFHQARTELYCPPCRLVLGSGGDEEENLGPAPLSVVNGVVFVKPDIVPQDVNPERFLLWYFRHELAHAHHCPYDLKTAYSLERAAYEMVRSWSLAYLATFVFSDLQVNINYLTRRFQEVPYLLEASQKHRGKGPDVILQGIYRQALPGIEPSADKDTEEAAKEIYTIIRSTRPWQWHTKVQMIAVILERLMARKPEFLSDKGMGSYVQGHSIKVREDFYPDSVRLFEDVYGTIQDRETAREFFKQWVEPRISKKEKKEIKERLKKKIKVQRSGRRGNGWAKEGAPLGPEDWQKPEGEDKFKGVGGPASEEAKHEEEPILPTSMSKPYKRIDTKVFNDTFWKRYWYRSRAEKTLIQYLAESPSRRPVWAVTKYPDEWYIEDEIEELDIEMSLDEGSLIPEVNTLKWVNEPTSQGQSVISGFVPSAIVILDASKSMSKIHDAAATAAFIPYMSASKAGGQTAIITFSTEYITADWGDMEETKEMVLSTAFDDFTVFPAYELMNLVSTATGNCFITIITDGGWQNLEEAIPLLERIADRGHEVFLFHLPGGEYPERIKRLRRSSELKIYKVDNPERDLSSLVLSRTMKTYQTFLI